MAAKDFITVLERVFDLRILSHQPVSGGDIAESSVLNSSQGPLFVKVLRGPEAYDVLTAEADGLKALKETGAVSVPALLGCAKTEFGAALLMEYIPAGSASEVSQEKLGRALALLHQSANDAFGWHRDNYIGSLAQHNSWESSWDSFFARRRLWVQYEKAVDAGFLKLREVPAVEQMIQKISTLVAEVRPALLHGDLWGGNYLVSKQNALYLIDPSVYFGHSEVDLAMTRLFGGFSSRFYEAYFEVSPALPGLEDRIQLYQLYYLLVHLNIFGRSYLPAVAESTKAVFGLY